MTTWLLGRGSGISTIGNVSLIIRGSEFIGNDAAIYGLGGPIALYGGSLELSDSLLSENDGGYAGGALLLTHCSAMIARSTISYNLAEEGGGISIRGGTTYLSECTIAHNGVGSYRNGGVGGGIEAENGVLFIRNSTITGNGANHEIIGGRGGGLYLPSTKLDIISTIVAGNSVTGARFLQVPTFLARSFPATATTSSAVTSTGRSSATARELRPACCSPASTPTPAAARPTLPASSPCATTSPTPP